MNLEGLTIIEQIKMSFSFTGFEPYSVGFDENDDTKQNNYEVTISYKGKELKFPYAFGNTNLEGMVTDVLENMFKLDILGKIVVDCYPPKSIDELKQMFYTKGFKDDYLKTVLVDITAQSDKLRKLFDENDLQELKIELSDWFNSHPSEAKSLGWKKEMEITD